MFPVQTVTYDPGCSYSHLESTERATIMLMRRDGSSLRAIARRLDRDPSTISREIRRQPADGTLPYEATRAAAQAFWQNGQRRASGGLTGPWPAPDRRAEMSGLERRAMLPP